MYATKLSAIIALALAAAGASAQPRQWEATGSLGLDSRTFWQDHRFADQQDGTDRSLSAQAELYWRSTGGHQRASVIGFARYDAQDDERTHADLREAYWGYDGTGWDANIGVNKIFWGVAESRHLVDVINQTDLVEDIDQEDKLGQPMLNVNLERDFGRFEIYLLPVFRERTFPGPNGRLRAPLSVDTDNPIYEASDKKHHRDIALRYSHYFGDVDLGAYVFKGTSREPGFVLDEHGDQLLPVYEQMTQAGMDLQYTRDSWLWKFEGIHRKTRDDAFTATVAGLEYTFYGVANHAADVGMLVEYLYDGRGPSAPPTVFDNDVFVGARLALNDASDTTALVGAVVDIDTHETFFSLEAERRFGDNVTVDLRLRAFSSANPGDMLFALERDDYVQLRVSWYY